MNNRSQSDAPPGGHRFRETDPLERRDQRPRRAGPLWSHLRHWMRTHTMAPSWLPTPVCSPVVSYLAAVIIAGSAVALTMLLENTLPGFGHRSLLVILGVVLVALTWGSGPSLVTTLVGALLLDLLLPRSLLAWSLTTVTDVISLGLVLGVGLLISLVAGQVAQARLQGEQARTASETWARELETILETITDGVVVVDQAGRTQRINRAGLALLRRYAPPDDLARPPGERLAEARVRDETGHALTPEQFPVVRVLGGETLSGAERADIVLDTLSGADLHLEISGAPLCTAEGQQVGAVVVSRDVTERRRLEREVAERAQELEAIFASMTEGVFVLDAAGGIRRVNAFAREILGPEEPHWQGRSMEEQFAYLLPRDQDLQVVPFERLPAQRVLRGEVLTGARAVDVLYRRADGSTLVTSMGGTPLRDPKGAIMGAVLVAHDITDRWRLERRTRASLEAVLAMAEILVMPEPVPAEAPAEVTAAALAHRVLELTCQVLGGANATFVSRESASDEAHLLASVGFTPEQEEQVRAQVDGTRFADRYTDPHFLAHLHAGEVQILDLEQPSSQERRPLASVRQAVVVPLRLGETLLGVMSLNQEEEGHTYTPTDVALAQGMGRLTGLILERERLLREREEARAKVLALSETTRQMDAFLSIVSHELRTPVTTIKGSVQLLLKRGKALAARTISPEDHVAVWSSQQTGLQRIEKQIARLTRLLDDLIDLTRIRSGKLAVQVERCDLGALVEEVVEEEQLAQPNRAISLTLPKGGSVQVLADADRTGQVLTNYLTNALKYSPPTQPVEVGVSLEDGQARVWVRDQGPGIPPEEQAALWNPFHRVPGIEVQSGSGIGLGLGLYISKTMIERQSGQVGVESHPGAGSTFWMTLPLASQ